MKKLELNKNDFQRQFEALVDNELITIEFSEQERKTFLTKMLISEHLVDAGYQEQMIQLVLDFLREHNTKVVPTCKEVKSFMRKHRAKYKDMLPVGIAL